MAVDLLGVVEILACTALRWVSLICDVGTVGSQVCFLNAPTEVIVIIIVIMMKIMS